MKQLSVCTAAGLVSAGLAYLIRKYVLNRSDTMPLRPRKARAFVHYNQENTSVEAIRKDLMLALMDHPGLLFGWRDPTLRNSYFADNCEFTEEF